MNTKEKLHNALAEFFNEVNSIKQEMTLGDFEYLRRQMEYVSDMAACKINRMLMHLEQERDE